MKRREFITLVGCAVASPLAVRAQSSAKSVIGFLNSGSAETFAPYVAAFRAGLAEAGHDEKTGLVIEFRWADGQYSRLPDLAKELVQRRVSLIAATGGISSAKSARAATASIPIVFTTGFDPVEMGLVPSLNKPGDNMTGVAFLAAELSAKRIDILRQLAPSARITLLINPDNPNGNVELADARAAAETAGQSIRVLNVSSERDLDDLAANFARERPEVLLVSSDPVLITHHKRIISLAAQYAIPAMYAERQIVLDGGLLSYGASIAEVYRQAGVYAGKILNGARPVDLPILRPTKFELVVNLKTAKALGLTMPAALLALTDEVIE